MRIERSSDAVESFAERAVYFLVGGGVAGFLAFLLLRYKGDGLFTGLGWVLALAAAGLILYGLFLLTRTRKVGEVTIDCPICLERNLLTVMPENDDVRCVACNHMIPIKEGVVLKVEQVRCGFCNSLNHYSEKTEVLICESCNHEIPIHQDENRPQKQIPKFFTATDDAQAYELVLIDAGKGTEDLVSALQKMLALNRNQVKDILESCPVTLLQGIPRMKAEMLQAQIQMHGAQAEFRVIGG